MSSINRILRFVGLKISKIPKTPFVELVNFKKNLLVFKENRDGYLVFEEFHNDTGDHPESYINYECEFATRHLIRLSPQKILDIGSYRLFLIGLLAFGKITTVDVRQRTPTLQNEILTICDAKKLSFPEHSFDVVISLSSIEHFGLGRYGDDIDPSADRKAIDEMIRVLKPNGRLIFSTTLTRGEPVIVYNAHRIYNHSIILEMVGNMECEYEEYYSTILNRSCNFEEITNAPLVWDVYLGCWIKRGLEEPFLD
jgi:SAM-dependent methyltransferase